MNELFRLLLLFAAALAVPTLTAFLAWVITSSVAWTVVAFLIGFLPVRVLSS